MSQPKPRRQAGAWALARDFMLRPHAAAERCRERGGLRDALLIYAVWAAASLLFARYSPLDALDPNAAIRPPQPAGFWLRVALWEPVIFAFGIATTALSIAWMRDGWLPLKTAAATLWSAAPLVLSAAYHKDALGRGGFILGLAVWAAASVPAVRRLSRRDLRELAAFLLGLNAIGLATLPPLTLAIASGSMKGYYAVALVSAFWMIWAAGKGLRVLAGMSMARAVMAFLFGFAALQCFIAAAFILKWIPVEVLKVLIYV